MLDRQRIGAIIQESIQTKELLIAQCLDQIESSAAELSDVLKNGGMILFCGNGGSAADAQHIAAELVIRFRGGVERRALPAMSLAVDPSMSTAGGNDYGYEHTFERMVEAFGRPGSALVGISTSGNSANVGLALKKAREMGMRTIGLLGNGGGSLLSHCDSAVVVPSSVTARIQECHITIGHIWCEFIEESLFPELFS